MFQVCSSITDNPLLVPSTNATDIPVHVHSYLVYNANPVGEVLSSITHIL